MTLMPRQHKAVVRVAGGVSVVPLLQAAYMYGVKPRSVVPGLLVVLVLYVVCQGIFRGLRSQARMPKRWHNWLFVP